MLPLFSAPPPLVVLVVIARRSRSTGVRNSDCRSKIDAGSTSAGLGWTVTSDLVHVNHQFYNSNCLRAFPPLYLPRASLPRFALSFAGERRRARADISPSIYAIR